MTYTNNVGFVNFATMVAANANFSGGAATDERTLGLQTDGQLWIGSTALNAGGTNINVGKIINNDSTITVSYVSPNIVISAVSSSAETLTGNSGLAVSPSSNNINTVGTGSITIAGNPGTHTLTTQLTGLTANSVLFGQGTSNPTIGLVASGTTGQVLQTNTGAAPTFSTATYPSTTTVSQLLYSSSNNVVAGLATGNNGVLITSNSGVPSWLADGTTGQVLTATTGSPPTWTTMGGFAWTDEAMSFNAAISNGYFDTATLTATLPASPSQGNQIDIVVVSGTTTIQANTGQFIRLGNTISASAGTAANTATGASISLVFRNSDSVWYAIASTGNWVIT